MKPSDILYRIFLKAKKFPNTFTNIAVAIPEVSVFQGRKLVHGSHSKAEQLVSVYWITFITSFQDSDCQRLIIHYLVSLTT